MIRASGQDEPPETMQEILVGEGSSILRGNLPKFMETMLEEINADA